MIKDVVRLWRFLCVIWWVLCAVARALRATAHALRATAVMLAALTVVLVDLATHLYSWANVQRRRLAAHQDAALQVALDAMADQATPQPAEPAPVVILAEHRERSA